MVLGRHRPGCLLGAQISGSLQDSPVSPLGWDVAICSNKPSACLMAVSLRTTEVGHERGRVDLGEHITCLICILWGLR